MIKNFLGLIAGYIIFVITSVLLFKLSGNNAHAHAAFGFQLFTALYGIVFSILSGFVSQLIVNKKNLSINYELAVLIAGFATFSFFKAEGSHWTQLLAIFIFAPVSILGGVLYLRKKKY
jgi:hypothetical protein